MQTLLFQKIYQKISIEEVYHWIKAGYKSLTEDPNKIKSSFIKCGYVDNGLDQISEISLGIEAMDIENGERLEDQNVLDIDGDNNIDRELEDKEDDDDVDEDIQFWIEGIEELQENNDKGDDSDVK